VSRLGEGDVPFDLLTAQNLMQQPDPRIAWYKPASQEAVDLVLAADVEDEDGRSEWLWIRLANGDLILGVMPQGETYFETEEESAF